MHPWKCLVIILPIVCCSTQLKGGSPYFLTDEKDAFTKNGSKVVFDCSLWIPKGERLVSAFWFRGKNKMETFDRQPKPRYSKSEMVMTLRKVKPRDSDRYRCRIKSSKGIFNRTFHIPPTKPPYIISKDLHKEVEANGGVRFKCGASPYYTSSYKWYFQGKELKTQRDSGIKIKKYSFLKIKRVTFNHQGFYKCEVTNAIGVAEVIYTLTVKGNEEASYAPVLDRNISQVVDIVMNNVNLNCKARGKSPFNITWFKNGQPIEDLRRKKNFTFTHDRQMLQLRELHPDDEGKYTCIVSNQYGSFEHTISVDSIEQVKEVPMFIGESPSEPFYVLPGENLTVIANVVMFGTTHIQLLKHVNSNQADKNVTEPFKVLNIQREDVPVAREGTNGGAKEYLMKYYFINITGADLGFYSIMAGNKLGFNTYDFEIAWQEPDALSTPKPFKLHKEIWFITTILACALMSVIVITLFLWRKLMNKKNPETNNNKSSFTKKNLEVVTINLTGGGGGVITRLSNSTRISSIRTEKEYFQLPVDKEWEVDFEDIELRDRIGEGEFGRVMIAHVYNLPKHPDIHQVAVKMLKENPTDQELKDLLSEIQVMKTVGRHSNVVSLLGVSTQHGELCLIMEYCRYGNLRQFLKLRRPVVPSKPAPVEQLTLFDLTSFCLQVAKGMDFLASKKCIHRDIAARNVLVADDHVLKIADFGLARDVHDRDYYRKLTDGRLPVKWMAIEALFDRVYTVHSDIWSYGILAWEIVTFGGSPYPGVPLEKLFDLLKQGYRMEKPINCTDEMYSIMLNCWKEVPSSRPAFIEIIDILEEMLKELGNSEYLDLEPPVMCPYDFQSTSSSPPPTPLISAKDDTSVFGDDDDDDTTVGSGVPEECVDLLPERRGSLSHSDLHTKL